MDQTSNNEATATTGEADAASQDAPDWDKQPPGAPLLKPGDFQESLPMSDGELFGFEEHANTSIDSNFDFEPSYQVIS